MLIAKSQVGAEESASFWAWLLSTTGSAFLWKMAQPEFSHVSSQWALAKKDTFLSQFLFSVEHLLHAYCVNVLPTKKENKYMFFRYTRIYWRVHQWVKKSQIILMKQSEVRRVITVRQVLRLDDYLLNASTNQQHGTIGGTNILNEPLINFTSLAEEYNTNYKSNLWRRKIKLFPQRSCMWLQRKGKTITK